MKISHPTLLALLVLSACSTVQIQSPPTSWTSPTGLPSTLLTRVSVSANSMNEAVAQVAPSMWKETQRSTLEVCALICQHDADPNQWVIPVTTSGSSMMCWATWRSCPVGTTSTGVSVHTHGSEWNLLVRAVDVSVWPDLVEGTFTPNGNPHMFSDDDLLQEEAYLITPSKLVRHEIHGKESVVADFSLSRIE